MCAAAALATSSATMAAKTLFESLVRSFSLAAPPF